MYQSSSTWLPAESCFSLFCCDVILSHSNLVATYTSELYLPVAQCQVSHQGLCALKSYMLGYELLFSLGTSSLSLKEQHLSVNVLLS